MKQVIFLFLALNFIGFSIRCQNLTFKPAFAVILNSSQAKNLLSQCSRSTPKVKGFWTPTQNEIDILENNFRSIYTIASEECCMTGGRVDSLGQYAFQYVGVIINKQKFIYVNAFRLGELEFFKRHNQDPTKSPIIVYDGGSSYWGALFEVRTLKFSHLAFNGVA